MANDFDDSGVGRDVKWVLLILGLLLLFCVFITIVYIFKRLLEKKKETEENDRLDRDYATAPWLKKVLLAEHHTHEAVKKVDNTGNSPPPPPDPPVFKGINMILSIIEERVRQQEIAAKRRQAKMMEKKYTKLIVVTVNGSDLGMPAVSSLVTLFNAYYKSAEHILGFEPAQATTFTFTDNVLFVIIDGVDVGTEPDQNITFDKTIHNIVDRIQAAGAKLVILHDCHPSYPSVMKRFRAKLTGSADRAKYIFTENKTETISGDIISIKQVEGSSSEFRSSALLESLLAFLRTNFVKEKLTYLDLVVMMSRHLNDPFARVQIKSTSNFTPDCPVPLIYPSPAGSAGTTIGGSNPDSKTNNDVFYESPYIHNPLEEVFPVSPRRIADANWMVYDAPRVRHAPAQKEWMLG
eukprot:TRINITY_DN36871_c0_g1_i1.p1 TRINITY_DN36871_c0_g1~~TRINITY_DN36871_c0_g1_i1.p1  ORF type:complete len:408 (+),score=75.10 TRINITY_DN36871_c0_g1_i1:40-1263(+)